MHKTSGRWQLGLLLSLITATFWGALPIALKGLLNYLDPVTITWLRFLIAALVLAGYLHTKNLLPSLTTLNNRRLLVLLGITVFSLLLNYISYMVGLSHITPESAQIVIQLAPILLLLGSLLIFKEKFNLKQWLGLCTFLTGLVLFFNQRIEGLLQIKNDYNWGLFLIFVAAVLWASYALAQKQLLKYLSSPQIMITIYIVGGLLYIPVSEPALILELDAIGWALLLFCAANTLVAYGAFAEALEHWEASRVGAVLAITPLLTLLFMQVTNYYQPDFIQPESLNFLSFFGAIMVVIGSATTALCKSK